MYTSRPANSSGLYGRTPSPGFQSSRDSPGLRFQMIGAMSPAFFCDSLTLGDKWVIVLSK